MFSEKGKIRKLVGSVKTKSQEFGKKFLCFHNY